MKGSWSEIKTGVFVTFVSLVLTGAGLVLTACDVVRWVRWTGAEARITSAAGAGIGESSDLLYEYEVGGRAYSGKVRGQKDSTLQSRRIAALPQDGRLRIVYNPARPEDSLPVLSLTAMPLFITLFGAPFLLLSACLLWRGVTGRDLIEHRSINGSTPVPGGGAFLIFAALGVVTCFGLAIAAFKVPLRWPQDLLVGCGLLVGNIAAYAIIARRLARRRRSRVQAGKKAGTRLPSLGTRLALAIGATVFWCGIVGVFAVFVGSAFYESWAARDWPAAAGTITASDVEVHHGSRSSTTKARLQYEYAVGGQKYVGHHYSFIEISSNGPEADQVHERYPAGSRATVYYDPADPAQSVLERGVTDTAWGLALFLQPFVLVGLLLVAWTVRLPKKMRAARALFDPAASPPLEIPGWGAVRQTPEGLTVEPRRPWLRGTPRAGLAAYGVAAFFGMFVILVPYFVAGISTRPLLVPVLGLAVALAVAAAAVRYARRSKGVVVRIDAARRTVTVARPGKDESFAFDQVKSWRVRQVDYPYGTTVNDNAVQYLLVEAILGDHRTVPLHAFRGSSDMEVTRPVAHRMKDLLAGWTAGKVTQEEVEDDSDYRSYPKPLALILGIWASLRGRPEYEDIA
jgi:hypothetical protein